MNAPVLETITRPWKSPVDYLQLVFFTVLYLVVVMAMYDSLKILASWVAQSVTD